MRWRVVAAGLALASCASEEGALRPPGPVVPPDTMGPVELIDAGGEPRRTLRYHFERPLRRNLQLELATGVLALRKAQQDAEIGSLVPPLAMILQVGSLGQGRYQFRVADLQIVPPPSHPEVRRLGDLLRQEIGSSGHVAFDERGISSEFSVVDRVKASQRSVVQVWMMRALMEALQQIAVPLPEAAVGAGAIWSWTVVRYRGGFEVKRLFTARLIALDGDHGRVDLSVVATARPLAGAGRDVTEIKSHGTGAADFDLGCAIALPFELREGVSVHEMSAQGRQPNEFVTLFFSGIIAQPR